MRMLTLLEDSPVIAAVKSEEGLQEALQSDCQVLFLLMGTICDISRLTQRVREAGKTAVVHADLIAGLGVKEVAVDYIREQTKADGVISTKVQLVKRARELGMLSILRTFVVDSMALANLSRQIEIFHPDAIEVMPGIMPRIIGQLRRDTTIPLIAGGLLTTKKEVFEALGAGADAISTTQKELWKI